MNQEKLYPRLGSCLVELLDNHQSTLLKPESAQREGTLAHVLRVGPDEDVVPGDRVVLGKYVGHELKLDGKDCLLVSCSDILAVVEN
jgi:co-chaperonin GroES (HSP10)